MAFGNTTTSYDALLKDYYDDDKVANAIFKKNPFLALMRKFENSVGREFVHPLVWGTGQGRSGSFSQSQNLAGLSGENTSRFLLTLVENFATANVSNQVIAAAGDDRGAFLDSVTLIADDQLQNLTNDLGIGVWGTTDRNRGQVSNSSFSTSVLTLVNAKDALKFEVGMELDVAAAQSTGNVRAYGTNSHGLYVTKVDTSAGTVTVGLTPVANGTACNLSDAADGIPTIAQNDFIYVRGDRNVGMAGFSSWIPSSSPASNDSFFGVNRSANAVRLAGSNLDGRGGNTAEVLESAAATVAEVGGELSHFLMSPKKYADLANSLGSKVQIVDVPVTASIGFKGIQVVGPTGTIICLPDRNCPSTTIAGVNIADWQMNSVKKAARVWDEDGKIWLRSATQAGMEIRFYSLANVICKMPRNQINITVSA